MLGLPLSNTACAFCHYWGQAIACCKPVVYWLWSIIYSLHYD